MMISGKTELYALLGSPVSHSGSPAMYNYCFTKMGIDAVYVAFDVKKEKIKQAIEGIRTLGIRGFNLTMPCKNDAIFYLDEISDSAKMVGAVNTVINDNGILKGTITDGIGFVNHLEANGIFVKGKKITVAGSGGAGTAIQVELAKRGAREISILSRLNGFYQRAVSTVQKIQKIEKGTRISLYDIADTETVTKEVSESDIFVNATIVGMKPKEEESVLKDRSAFHKGLVVCDAVYNPVETRLLREAKEYGLVTVDGRGMLLYQGAEAFKLFTGKEMPIKEVYSLFFS